MLNAAAPEGKERKYARRECERRFLFAAPPEGPVVRRVRVLDRYVPDTRIRLRRMSEIDDGGTVVNVTCKLTQKVPASDGSPGLITTMYLMPAEYDVLAALPAATLRKTRLSIPPLGVDLFEGELSGLVTGEAEFGDEASLAAFVPPNTAVAEVTRDPRFTGGRLATTTAPVLAALLAEHGLRAKD